MACLARMGKTCQMSSTESSSERVLILAPQGRDATLAFEILDGAGFDCHVCKDMPALCRSMRAGAAAALITQEALTPQSLELLTAESLAEPAWSVLPLVIMLTSGAQPPETLHELEARKSISVLER